MSIYTTKTAADSTRSAATAKGGGHLVDNRPKTVMQMKLALAAPQMRNVQMSVIQPMTIYQNGAYFGIDKNKQRDGSTRGEKDAKINALHDVARRIKAELNKIGLDGGPHIAVSVVGKRMFVAVNTGYKLMDGKKAVNQEQLLEAATKAVAELRLLQPGPDTPLNWVSNIPKGISVIGAKKKPTEGTIHGEQLIMHHLLANENTMLDSRREKLAGLGLNKNSQRVIRIGGTIRDCDDCYTAHHGNQPNTPTIGSNDYGLLKYETRVLSPGRSGKKFNNVVRPRETTEFSVNSTHIPLTASNSKLSVASSSSSHSSIGSPVLTGGTKVFSYSAALKGEPKRLSFVPDSSHTSVAQHGPISPNNETAELKTLPSIAYPSTDTIGLTSAPLSSAVSSPQPRQEASNLSSSNSDHSSVVKEGSAPTSSAHGTRVLNPTWAQIATKQKK